MIELMERTAFNEKGFILVATLWVLAGLGLLASYIDGLTDLNVQRALQHKQNIQLELDLDNTRATLVYLFTTSRMNDRALILEEEQHLVRNEDDVVVPGRDTPEILLNDTVYQGLGDVLFSVQDEGGLAPINSFNFPMFTGMLHSIGLSQTMRSLVIGRLQDYTDANQALSLNGAEFYEYSQKKLPPPANALMKSPLELRMLLGFEEMFTAQQWAKLRPYLTMREVAGYNFNTMPKAILMALFGNRQAVVKAIISLREEERIYSASQIERATGKQFLLDGEDVRDIPSTAIRISLWQKNSRRRTLSGVEFTPSEKSSPWRIDYHYSEQHDEATNEQDSDPIKNAPTALL